MRDVSFYFQENRRPRDTLHNLRRCCGRVLAALSRGSTKKNPAIKGMNITQMTLQPYKTYGVFIEKARGVVERNHFTCRSERMISSWCLVQHLSTSGIFTPSYVKLIWSDVLHLHRRSFESPTPCHHTEIGVFTCIRGRGTLHAVPEER